MPEDIFVNEELDTEYDDVGDIASVAGDAYVHQTVVVAVVEQVGLDAPTLDPTPIEEHRSRIADVVADHHATTTPTSVTIADVNADEQSITYLIESANAEFSLTAA